MQRVVQSGQCPECGSSWLVTDQEIGEVICSECGLVVIKDMFNRGPEWRAYTIEERHAKSRTGVPTNYTYFDKGLSTTMYVNQDAFGQPLPTKTKIQMWRLRKWQIRSQMGDKGLNLMKAMNELRRLSEKLHIPSSVQESAAVIYRKALKEDLIRGRSIVTMVAASLYAACRLTGIAKTLREVVKASRVRTSLQDRKDIARCYRMLLQKLEMRMPLHDPLDYLSKVAEMTGIPCDVQGLAVKILHEAKEEHITAGKDPLGIVAATLYIACQLRDQNITQADIAAAANVSEVTIRNRKKDLETKLNPFLESCQRSNSHSPLKIAQRRIATSNR